MSRKRIFHTILLAALGVSSVQAEESRIEAVISVKDQRLVVLCDGEQVARYPVSTSRYGTGDEGGSYKTPLGRLKVCDKLGGGLPEGAVIHHRQATGEVIPANAPGRDPIVTRILWLEGCESQNAHARERSIYIHGTAEEKAIGKPVSFGCVRMKSCDVTTLYEELPVGATINIIADRLPHYARYVAPKVAPVKPEVEKPETVKPEVILAARHEAPAPTPAKVAPAVAALIPTKTTPALVSGSASAQRPPPPIAAIDSPRKVSPRQEVAMSTATSSSASPRLQVMHTSALFTDIEGNSEIPRLRQ